MNVLILGATSEIAVATAHAAARRGASSFLLAGRDEVALKRVADDLSARYETPAAVCRYDAVDWPAHAAWVEALDPLPDLVVVAVGLLGDQELAQTDPEHAQAIVTATYSGLISTLEPLSARLAQRGSGRIAVMGSVAGLRGRQSNYIYGSAKAGLHAYASGLRNRLARSGVHVMTALIGWVDTRMLDGQDLPGALVAPPQAVGDRLVRSLLADRNCVYLPWFWRFIMLIIRMIPEAVFKKLRL